MNYKTKSRRRFFLLVRSRTPRISSEFEHPKPPSRYVTAGSRLKFDPWTPPPLRFLSHTPQFTDSSLCLASQSITTGANLHSFEESYLRQVERATFNCLLFNSWPAWFSSGPVYVFPGQSQFGSNCSTVSRGRSHSGILQHNKLHPWLLHASTDSTNCSSYFTRQMVL